MTVACKQRAAVNKKKRWSSEAPPVSIVCPVSEESELKSLLLYVAPPTSSPPAASCLTLAIILMAKCFIFTLCSQTLTWKIHLKSSLKLLL